MGFSKHCNANGVFCLKTRPVVRGRVSATAERASSYENRSAPPAGSFRNSAPVGARIVIRERTVKTFRQTVYSFQTAFRKRRQSPANA